MHPTMALCRMVSPHWRPGTTSNILRCMHFTGRGPLSKVILACRDRRFFVWAKWVGGSKSTPPGPTTFRSGRTFGRAQFTFERVTTPELISLNDTGIFSLVGDPECVHPHLLILLLLRSVR